MNPRALLIAAFTASSIASHGAVKVDMAFDATDKSFKMDPVPPPSTNDAATSAEFKLVSGQRDGNGADLTALHDGKVPGDEDQPSRNFFFQGNGGRIVVDLGKAIDVKSINTYSWHSNTRGPQVYKLYAAGEGEKDFNAAPAADKDPRTAGWKPITKVDTRPKGEGGKHAVSISDSSGDALGKFRYLMFEAEPTQGGGQSNTFFSEIDVVDKAGPTPTPVPGKVVRVFPSSDNKYTYTLDATIAPDLENWAETELMPVVKEWYPKICEMLPSDGYTAPAKVTLEFRDDMEGIPAYAAGNKLSMNAPWFRTQLKGEARGCVIHELTHVVQNYWVRPKVQNPTRAPGWVTEGIPDYIRWFVYEPQSKGAEITKGNFRGARYDASYRTTANFLNWVVENKDKQFIGKLNAAAREGRYSDKIWQDAAGATPAQLGDEWKAANAKRLGIEPQ